MVYWFVYPKQRLLTWHIHKLFTSVTTPFSQLYLDELKLQLRWPDNTVSFLYLHTIFDSFQYTNMVGKVTLCLPFLLPPFSPPFIHPSSLSSSHFALHLSSFLLAFHLLIPLFIFHLRFLHSFNLLEMYLSISHSWHSFSTMLMRIISTHTHTHTHNTYTHTCTHTHTHTHTTHAHTHMHTHHTHTHTHTHIQKVRLFSTVQDNIVDNLLELTSAVTSRKLHSVLEYLTLTTTATIMPRGSILQRLWEMVADPHVSFISPLLIPRAWLPSLFWWLTVYKYREVCVCGGDTAWLAWLLAVLNYRGVRA